MRRGQTGRYETTVAGGERVTAFIPTPLPPDPQLELGALQAPLEAALLALGRLDGLTRFVPAARVFQDVYIRKEAVLSSQIEGIQSSLSDLLRFEQDELPAGPVEDVLEVSNYVAALEHGLARMRGGFPLSIRLLREMHERLLAGGRNSHKMPGELRRSQNWIGGARPAIARFVPPPPHLVPECLSELERFLHAADSRISTLMRAGLAHVQFETIHPFLDGNGRLGRLLITLMLRHDGTLREPLLYLSLYLKQHRDEYYALLDAVRSNGDWEAWLAFFLDGVTETAEGCVSVAQRLMALFGEDRVRVQQEGRAAGSALRLHEVLQHRPIVSLQEVVDRSGLSFAVASSAMQLLERLGITRELTGKKRDLLFGYHQYVAILNEGTELPAE